jgi:phosphate-selective porin OprO and OprP
MTALTVWWSLAAVAADDEQMAEAPVGPADVVFRPGKGLVVSSADGRFALRSQWRMQLRYVLTEPPGDDPLEQAFQLRRARWTWSGHFFGEHNRFEFELNLSPQDVGLDELGVQNGPLRDAFVQFTHLRDLTLAVGQMKVSYSRQFNVSSGDLMLVDRSAAHDEFSLDRDVGLQLTSDDLGGTGRIGYSLGLFSGQGAYGWEPADLGLLYVARLELLPAGPFAADEESDQARSRSPKVAVGAAVAYLDEAPRDRGITGSTPADGGTTDTRHATGDIAFRFAGVSADAAVHWRDGDRNAGPLGGPVAPPRDAVGAMVQAGWLLPCTRFEPAARWARVRPTHAGSAVDPVEELGLGASWYVAEHAYKLQTDVFRRTSPAWPEPEVEARVQLQASI